MTEAAMATLEISQVVLDAAQMNTHDLRLELALTLYAQHRLSLGKARELAGLTLWEFRQWLGLRRIEAHYNTTDLQDDIQTLRELGRLA
jgi:predicted HTH domain antitoxin